MLRTFKELKVWAKAYDVCLKVYAATRTLPSDERFGLTAQIRRAAVSIPSNIAEGYNRGSTRDYVRFLLTASGSVAELETQLLLSRDLKLGHEAELARILDGVSEVERMLKAMIRSLRRKLQAGSPRSP